MIGGEASTPLDLRFRLGPFPVRISVMFWVVTLIFGYYNTLGDAGNMWVNILLWAACVFVSILGHELGHAIAYRLFGSWASVTLYGFGGYAQADEAPPAAWQRMLVSLAGPAAGFVLYGVTELVKWKVEGPGVNAYAHNAIEYMIWINLFWTIFNLFPIPPLDGGNVCREFLNVLRVRQSAVIAHGIGFVLALALAVYGGLMYAHLMPVEVARQIPYWGVPGPMLTLFLALLAVDNFQRMQLARRRVSYYQPPDDDYEDDTPPWRRR